MAAKVLSVALVALLAYQVSASPFLNSVFGNDSPRQGLFSGLFNRQSAPTASANLPNAGLQQQNSHPSLNAKYEADLLRAKYEADLQKVKLEADMKAKYEAELLKAKIEADLRAKYEADYKAQFEADVIAKYHAEQKAKHDAAKLGLDLKDKLDGDLKGKFEADIKFPGVSGHLTASGNGHLGQPGYSTGSGSGHLDLSGYATGSGSGHHPGGYGNLGGAGNHLDLKGKLDADLKLPGMSGHLTASGDGNFLTRTASTLLGAAGDNVKSSTNIATSGVTATEGAVKASLDLSTGIGRHVNKLGADLINAGVNIGKNGADIGNTNTKATLSIVTDGLSSSLDGLKNWGNRLNDWRTRAHKAGNQWFNNGIDLAKNTIRAGAELAIKAEDEKTRNIHAGLNGAASLSGSVKENIDAGLAKGHADLKLDVSASANDIKNGLHKAGSIIDGVLEGVSEGVNALANGHGTATFQLSTS